MKTLLTFFLICGWVLISHSHHNTDNPSSLEVALRKEHTTGPEKSDGHIEVQISGGTAPYQVLIVSVPLAHTKIFASEAKVKASSLKAGKYQIYVADYNRKRYFHELIIE